MVDLATYKKELDTAIAAETNAGAKTLMTGYKGYADKSAAAGVSFDTWLATEALSKATIEKIPEAQRATAATAAKTTMGAKKLNGAFKDGQFTAEESSGLGDWLSKNWPMLAAIVGPLILGSMGLFESIVPVLVIGAAAVGVAAYKSDKDSVLGQGLGFVKTKLGVDKTPAPPGAGAAVSGPGAPAAGSTAAEEERQRVANAQAELAVPGGANITSELTTVPGVDAKDVTLRIEAKSDATIGRTFKGNVTPDGTLTITDIMVIKEGETTPSVAKLKNPVIFKNVAEPVLPDGELAIIPEKLADAKSEAMPVPLAAGAGISNSQSLAGFVHEFGTEDKGKTDLPGSLLQTPVKAKITIGR